MAEENLRFNADRAGVYDSRIGKTIPGYDTLHKLVEVTLAAELPEQARLLIVGAGTGQEIVTLGKNHPGWEFTAIDPSTPMLEIAKKRVQDAGMAERVEWHEGTVEDLPESGTYDAATMLLALHFVPRSEKGNHLGVISDCLNPGAPLILADSFGDPDTTRFKRYSSLMQAWAKTMGLEDAVIAEMYDPSRKDLHRVAEDVIKSFLREAGFIDIQRLFQAYFIGAWLCRTPR